MSSDLYLYFFCLTVQLYGVASPDQFAGCAVPCLCKWHLLSVFSIFSMAKIQVRDLRPNPANPCLHKVSHLFWVNQTK